MKHLKKFVSVLLTMAMVMAMALTAFAADTTTITISGGEKGSEYAAYKLLDATDGGGGKFAYTVNEKYLDVLKEVTGKTTDAEIVAYIGTLNDDGIRTFADAVYAQVKANDLKADYTTANDTFENVDQGYYLIAETKTGNGNNDGTTSDTYSLVMLDTAGQNDITVKTKEGTPTLEKKVQEKNDSTGEETGWQDGADYDIGDEVPFQLTGTVSDRYADYKTYYYAFHDKMSAGLSFNAGSVVVKVGNTVIDASNYTVVTDGLTDGCTFEVVFDNLKDIEAVKAGSEITVEFTATLDDDAVIGQPGNPNEAKLEYNNNPYYEGDGKPEETGETPWDKVVVFTYKLNADKVDGNGAALAGAGFTLYKFDADKEGYVAVGDEIKDTTTFTFKGLDAGKYKLVETTVPAGYNKADDIIFIIDAAYDTEADEPELTGLVVKDENNEMISGDDESAVFSIDLSKGSVNTKVENKSGTELPETGGIGTTIFYVIGSILVLGAAVVMITRKRMAK